MPRTLVRQPAKLQRLAAQTSRLDTDTSLGAEEMMATRQRLTIFLLDDVSTFEDALEDPQTLHVDVQPAAGLDGVFYWTSRRATPPPWVSYLAPALSEVPKKLRSSSASGLLLLRAGGRYFAVTFGYGRGLLNPAKIVRQFGLRVALNTIDHEQIRSLDTKTFEDMVVSRNTQVSRSTDLPVFGVDVSRDILRAVTGEPRDRARFGKRVSGSDPVILTITSGVLDIPKICQELLTAFADTAYRQRFGWVDDLAIVRDDKLLAALDDLLAEQLRNGDTTSTHMAMPDPIDWSDINAFRIAGTRKVEYDDLDLDEYLTQLGSGISSFTPQVLRSRGVALQFSRGSDFERRWSLYQCLVSEQRIGDQLYVLIEGRWFEVSSTLSERVDAVMGALKRAPIKLLPSTRGEHEDDYNRRLAQAADADRVCLDAKILRPTGAASGIEFCDVLSRDGTLVHVKRKSRSSTLSHLFAQGVVSATTLLGDPEFRGRLRELIASGVGKDGIPWDDVIPGPQDVPDRERFRVSYVVIANSTRPGTSWLPFFSKLNLMQSVKTLQNMGIGVTLDRVDAG